MRSPLASLTFGLVVAGGLLYLGAPPAHSIVPSPRPVAFTAPDVALDVDPCIAAKLNLDDVTADLTRATDSLDGVTATADELTRRLGLGDLLGLDKTTNDAAIQKIRDVLSLSSDKVLATDARDTACGDDVDITVSPTPSAEPSSSAVADPPVRHRQIRHWPKRAPETGDGSSIGGSLADRAELPYAVALYANLSVGSAALVYVGRRWFSER